MSTGFTLEYDDLEYTYNSVVEGIKSYFSKYELKRAVLGLSGGLDSTICAVLLADALGAENVFGISMPSKITPEASKNDAEQLALNLGINYTEVPILNIVDSINEDLQKLFADVVVKWSENTIARESYTQDNIQARARATILFAVSNEFTATIPIATSDKSELYMGYSTINGDMSGGLAPIADVPKTKLFALGRWMNENRAVKNAIPQIILEKAPSAELAIDPKTGQPLRAEDALMPYEFIDEVIYLIENKNITYEALTAIELNYEIKHNISKTQKIEWLDKFYYRMNTLCYKMAFMPPCVVISDNSFLKGCHKEMKV